MLLSQSRKFERQVDSSVLKAYVEIYSAMSSKKKRKSSCPFASAKNAPKRKKMKTFDKDLAQALAASDKGSYFEQEKLLALEAEQHEKEAGEVSASQSKIAALTSEFPRFRLLPVPLCCLRPRLLFSPRLVFGISKYIC